MAFLPGKGKNAVVPNGVIPGTDSKEANAADARLTAQSRQLRHQPWHFRDHSQRSVSNSCASTLKIGGSTIFLSLQPPFTRWD